MNKIQLTGQVITCVNYTTNRIFNFNPEPIRFAAETFLSAGINEIEIPQAVLDPEGCCHDTGIDRELVRKTVSQLPVETKVIGTYLDGQGLGSDPAYLDNAKRAIDHLCEFFPDISYAMIHPAPKEFASIDKVQGIVDIYAGIAEYASSVREGFQICFHNHYDSSAESDEQVLMYLETIEDVGNPALRWGLDTGHGQGMGAEFLEILEKYAHLIGDYFHIKARVPAFDVLHGGEEYREDRDIWNARAEVGRGLYSGFVNAADPENQIPFKEIFRIIREKAKPTCGIVRGAMEIDVPRQHPRLEVLCETLYLKNVHGIKAGQILSNDEIINRVFKTKEER
jgi:sugar phosphate isomerase/epimerase